MPAEIVLESTEQNCVVSENISPSPTPQVFPFFFLAFTPPPFKGSRLASYFPFKILAFESPHPLEISNNLPNSVNLLGTLGWNVRKYQRDSGG